MAIRTSELPAMFSGSAVGTTYKVKGYRDSSGLTRDITVRTLPPEGYVRMKEASLKKLEETQTLPDVTGFPADLIRQAAASLMEGYRSAMAGDSFNSPLMEAKAGGYSTRPDSTAVYLTRLEVLQDSNPARDSRVDLTRAKLALARAMDLPVSRYIHSLKLEDGKFESVKKV